MAERGLPERCKMQLSGNPLSDKDLSAAISPFQKNDAHNY